jgi:hypothetical protein
MASPQEREIRFTIPESLAQRMERLEEMDPCDIARDLMLSFYDDGRRTQIEVHRLGVSWHPDIYKAMLKQVGSGGLSRYVRQILYAELSKYEKDLLLPPDWSDTRKQHRKTHNVESSLGRIGYISPIMIPAQWFERLAARFPGAVGPWLKAMVQKDLEKMTGKRFPVQRTVAEFLGRDE